MKVKGKAKQLFCMVCAFVASFMLTVTAFADSMFSIKNSYYIGPYDAVINPWGYIMVKEDEIKLNAYLDSTYGNISGSADSGFLTDTGYSFAFKEVVSVTEKGIPLNDKIINVTVTGRTKPKMGGILNMQIQSITLTPDGQSGNNIEKYVYTRF